MELTSFFATQNNNIVTLTWITANEINNYGFYVERHLVNENADDIPNTDVVWEGIGFVKGYGNSNSPKMYNYSDNPEYTGKIEYRLKQIDLDGNFHFSDKVEVNLSAVKNFTVWQNLPNPYNPTTSIKFVLPKTSIVVLIVYNILGKVVKELINEKRPPGFYLVEFDASNLPSGVYIYRISADSFTETKKMILLK